MLLRCIHGFSGQLGRGKATLVQGQWCTQGNQVEPHKLREDVALEVSCSLSLCGDLLNIERLKWLAGSGLIVFVCCTAAPFFIAVAAARTIDQSDQVRQRSKAREAEATNSSGYYKKWINEDVVYIITREERDVFLKLKTDEEREQFIEQFWFRRNPNPNSSANEYKEEHYRRLQYEKEKFSYDGKPGWVMDRRMVYIKYGQPGSIDHHDGGSYDRTAAEGGGNTIA